MKKDGQNLVALLFILGLIALHAILSIGSVFEDVWKQSSSTNNNQINDQKVTHTEQISIGLDALDTLEDDTIEEIIEIEVNETKPSCCACPEGLFLFEDIIVDDATYNDAPEGTIPKTIHFFSKSKCIPEQVYTVLNTWTNALQDYSILLHDYEEISTHLSKPRKDLPFLSNAFKCAFSHESILDLARFVFMYDYGGISTDLNQLPGEGMMKFANRTFVQPKHNDNYWIELENDQPRFIAATPKHINMYTHMQLSIANQYEQFAFNKTIEEVYLEKRAEIYSMPFINDYGPNKDYGNAQYRKGNPHGFNTISAIMSSRMEQDSFLKSISFEENVLEQTRFRTIGQSASDLDKEVKQCVDLNNHSFKVDYRFLEKIVGSTNDQHNKTCPSSNLTYIENSFQFASEDTHFNTTRKIPKILHMTSKNRCFTKRYAENIREWIKSTGYAFILHDDSAVDRLFRGKEWSEFPLLQQVIPCLTSGAMKADLWRYLALWEWGGLYTDMDNTPGNQWARENGNVISDDMDAVFEIEKGGFASQYFYASKLYSQTFDTILLSY